MWKHTSTKIHTLSYTVEDGVFKVRAFGYKSVGATRTYVFVTAVTDQAATDIVMAALQQSGKITRVCPSYSAPEVTYVLKKLKNAVKIIEAAALNPHTELGRRRLINEFNRLNE